MISGIGSEEKNMKKIFIIFFCLLLIFFILIRFPYGELKTWMLTRAAEKAGVNLVLSDSSILLPLGMELRDASLSGGRGVNRFSIRGIEELGVRLNLSSIFSSAKSGNFYLKRGGEGEGGFSLRGKHIGVDLDVRKINIGGLSLPRGIMLENGTLSLKGSLEYPGTYLKGSGNLLFDAENLGLKGLSPLFPELVFSKLKFESIKKERNITITNIDALIDGITIQGGGTVALRSRLFKSAINATVHLDFGKASDMALNGFAGIIKSLGGGQNMVKVEMSGTIDNPKLSVNGKALF